MIRRDVAAELVSPECALNVYDTVIDSQTGRVNREATEQRRRERRLHRLGHTDVVQLKSMNFRPPPEARCFSEYLVMTGNANVPQLQCRKCGHVFSLVTENWKNHAKVAERPLSVLGPNMSATKRFVLRDLYCPGCAAMIEVEMILKELPPIWDSQLKTPT